MTNPADTDEENLTGSVQVEMDPNLAEFQCFVTSLLLQVCVHGLQQWIPRPGPTAVSALCGYMDVGFKSLSCSGAGAD